MISNPYQNVIDWLHTPEGEQWSEDRIAARRDADGGPTLGPNHYGDASCFLWKGIMSLKSDQKAVGWNYRHTGMPSPGIEFTPKQLHQLEAIKHGGKTCKSYS